MGYCHYAQGNEFRFSKCLWSSGLREDFKILFIVSVEFTCFLVIKKKWNGVISMFIVDILYLTLRMLSMHSVYVFTMPAPNTHTSHMFPLQP